MHICCRYSIQRINYASKESSVVSVTVYKFKLGKNFSLQMAVYPRGIVSLGERGRGTLGRIISLSKDKRKLLKETIFTTKCISIHIT